MRFSTWKHFVLSLSIAVNLHGAAPLQGNVQGAFVWGVVNVGGLDSAIEAGHIASLPSVPGKGAELEVNYPLPGTECAIGVEGLLFSAHYTGQLSSASCALQPTWVGQESVLENVKTHYRLHLGCADLKWSTRLPLSSCLSVRPFVGILFASLRQKYFLDQQPCLKEIAILWRTKNKYWGLGPELGASVEWGGSKWFSLQMGGNLALLYGQFYVHEGRRLDPGEKQMRLFHEWLLGTTIMKMDISLCWYPATVTCPFTVELGASQSMFFSQNQLLRIGRPPSRAIVANQGDISLTAGYIRFGYQW